MMHTRTRRHATLVATVVALLAALVAAAPASHGAGTITWKGFVHDRDGYPLAGMSVFVEGLGSTTTGSDGTFVLKLPKKPATYTRVDVLDKGDRYFSTFSDYDYLGKSRSFDITMRRKSGVTGTIDARWGDARAYYSATFVYATNISNPPRGPERIRLTGTGSTRKRIKLELEPGVYRLRLDGFTSSIVEGSAPPIPGGRLRFNEWCYGDTILRTPADLKEFGCQDAPTFTVREGRFTDLGDMRHPGHLPIVAGRVTTSAGQPAASVTVQAYATATGTPTTTTTRADGSWSLTLGTRTWRFKVGDTWLGGTSYATATPFTTELGTARTDLDTVLPAAR